MSDFDDEEEAEYLEDPRHEERATCPDLGFDISVEHIATILKQMETSRGNISRLKAKFMQLFRRPNPTPSSTQQIVVPGSQHTGTMTSVKIRADTILCVMEIDYHDIYLMTFSQATLTWINSVFLMRTEYGSKFDFTDAALMEDDTFVLVRRCGFELQLLTLDLMNDTIPRNTILLDSLHHLSFVIFDETNGIVHSFSETEPFHPWTLHTWQIVNGKASQIRKVRLEMMALEGSKGYANGDKFMFLQYDRFITYDASINEFESEPVDVRTITKIAPMKHNRMLGFGITDDGCSLFQFDVDPIDQIERKLSNMTYILRAGIAGDNGVATLADNISNQNYVLQQVLIDVPPLHFFALRVVALRLPTGLRRAATEAKVENAKQLLRIIFSA